MSGPSTRSRGDYTSRPWVAPLIVVHRDPDDGEVGRPHDLEHRGACWCNPELVSCHTQARA